MRIINFTNQKGGTGKSTSTINIGAILGSEGYKVLIIDGDPQHNATFGLGFKDSFEKKITIYECMTNEVPIIKAIMKTHFKNVDIVPSSIKHANAELEIATMMVGRESLLKDSLNMCISDLNYDFIIFDSPPTLGLLHLNGLVAATEVIIPVDVGPFALEGINQLEASINLVQRKLNPALIISGVILTKYDSRNNLSANTYKDVENKFGETTFQNVIRNTSKIGEAQAAGIPISYFDPKGIGAIDYTALTREVIERGSKG